VVDEKSIRKSLSHNLNKIKKTIGKFLILSTIYLNPFAEPQQHNILSFNFKKKD